MSFHEVSFPSKLALGAIGGPIRNVNISQRSNGFESRNLAQYHSKRRFLIATPAMNINEGHDLLAFFEARFGKAYSFRFRDPFDHKSCAPELPINAQDQQIGIGNGLKTQFQLVKNYGEYQRAIVLPKAQSVQVAINGVQIASNLFLVAENGLVIFQTAPPNNAIIKAGFEFDCKTRFDIENLEMVMEAKNTVRFNTIELIEVLA